MVRDLVVRGFKSLEEVPLELGAVNVFVGANGSGKSNLLEALGVISSAISGRVDDASLKARGVRPGVPALYKTSFKGAGSTPIHIRFEVSSEEAEYSVSLYNPIEEPTKAWRYKHERVAGEGLPSPIGRSPASYRHLNEFASIVPLEQVQIDPSSGVGMLLEGLRDYAIYAPDTPTLRGLEPDPQPRDPLGLAGGGLPEALSTLLRDGLSNRKISRAVALADWVLRLGTSLASDLPISASVSQPKRALKFIDRYMSRSRNVLSGYDASEGILYVLFCAVLALHPSAPRLFSIDNFDQALNPRMARALSQVFCEWILERGSQVLLTTHNPLVLDGLPLLDDRVRLFAVDRNLGGRTVVQRVEITNEMIKMSAHGQPISEQWVTGLIGGVPSGI